MKGLLESHRIFLIGGPGGVGKTTTAAILGIQLASMGYKTVVLTVDPARRLAQALGLASFESELQKVALNDSELYASMLDKERYFDRVIEKFAKTETQKNKVLNHPIYRTMVESLGGTQEYAAMERLLEFAADASYEKIVVDTPPTHNATELLTAPGRLADFMDNSVLKWFQPDKGPVKLVAKGTQIAMKMLRKVMGGEFFDSFGSLVENFDGMQAGFRDRNLEVMERLKSPTTAFFLVSYPSEIRFMESKNFRKTLGDHGIPLKALLLNRLQPACPAVAEEDSENVKHLLEFYGALHQKQSYWVDQFSTLTADIPLLKLERVSGKLHDVATLSQIGKKLLS